MITLGTPHRGTPGADPIWVQFSFDYNYSDFWSYGTPAILYDLYDMYRKEKEEWQFMLWDDVSNELTDDNVCWNSQIAGGYTCPALLTNSNNKMLEFNQSELYKDKIIAFGGNSFDNKTIEYKKVRTLIGGPLSIPLYAIRWEHQALEQLSKLMAEMPLIPNGYPPAGDERIDDSYKPFQANDGMVPLTSALFLKPGGQYLFKVEKGKLQYNENYLEWYCEIEKCIPLDGIVDHLDLLDDKKIIDMVKEELINIAE